EVARERRGRFGEAQVEVDDDDRGAFPEPRGAAETRPRRRRGVVGRGGFAGTGAGSPVSSSQRASTSSSGGPKSNAGASPRSAFWRARSASVAAASPTTTPYADSAFSADTRPNATSR